MISLDTNIVLRYLLNDIPSQTQQVRQVLSGETPVYVTDVVVTEAVYVLQQAIGMPRTDIYALITGFLHLPNMVYNDFFLDQTLERYLNSAKLSFVDCYAAAEAHAYNNELVTFDKRLAKDGGAHVRQPA